MSYLLNPTAASEMLSMRDWRSEKRHPSTFSNSSMPEFFREVKVGREKLFLNIRYAALLGSDDNEYEPFPAL